jgi:hypothetical protein
MGDLRDRRDRRYNFQIPVTIVSRSGEVHLLTENVSYRGLFMRTDHPPPKMQLLRMRMAVPTQQKEIVTNVMVAHVAAPDAAVQGAGVSFYGLDGEPRAQWETFIQFVRDHHPDASERQAAADYAALQATKRTSEQLIIAVANYGAFERLVSRDIAQGSLLIHTSSALEVGAPVCVRLIHPITHDDFLLDGVVRRRLNGGGLSVGLPAMDERTRAALTVFARSDGTEEESFEIVDFESLKPPAIRSLRPQVRF